MRSSHVRAAAGTIAPRLDRTIAKPDVPPWTPRPPRGGWTPASGRAAAAAYADDVCGDDTALDPARVARAAYFELRRAVPGLHGADLIERLAHARAATIADEALADHTAITPPGVDEPAPF